MSGMSLSSTDMYTTCLLPCLPSQRLDPHPSPLQNSLSSPSVTQSQSCTRNGVGDVVPGAARLISETAQRVYSIGQKQKNDQHLRRVQALLSGRQAKGLTSGTARSPSLCPTPSPILKLPFSDPFSLLPAHMPYFLSLPFCLLPRIMVLELHQNNSSPTAPQVAGSYARAGYW